MTWATRADIAADVGKDQLNKWDVGILKMLQDQGLIEFNRRPRADGVTLEYIYRAKS